MQPLVALFFNNFLTAKIGNFCDLFPPQKASPGTRRLFPSSASLSFGTCESRYDCPRQSCKLGIRCAEHHPGGEGIGRRSMTAPTWNIVHLCRGGVPPPANGTGNPSPTRAAHQRICHREGRQARGDLPVQFYGHIGTDVEATPYREIPTDGIAVLGMTCFYPVAPI